MEFVKTLDKLKEEYKDNMIIRKNGTMLLDPGTIPRCRHMLFQPLSDELIKEYLIDEYMLPFPKQYIELLRKYNGCNILGVKLCCKKWDLAECLITIFGLPLLPTSVRAKEMEECFDVRIEDLRRHKDTPNSWLKCGCSSDITNFDNRFDLFIDTVDEKVYACNLDTADVVRTWNSLDECLCDLYNSLKDTPLEFKCN